VLVVGDSLVHDAQHWYGAQPELQSARPRLAFSSDRSATPQSLKLLLARSWPQQRPPKYVVVHVGSNNLGRLSALRQREDIASLWEFLPCLSDTTEFIWSDILPRASLRRPGDLSLDQLRNLDRVRREVNRYGRRLAVRAGGRFVKHMRIPLPFKHLFRSDGVHLSEAGQGLFVRDFLAGPTPFQGGCSVD